MKCFFRNFILIVLPTMLLMGSVVAMNQESQQSQTKGEQDQKIRMSAQDRRQPQTFQACDPKCIPFSDDPLTDFPAELNNLIASYIEVHPQDLEVLENNRQENRNKNNVADSGLIKSFLGDEKSSQKASINIFFGESECDDAFITEFVYKYNAAIQSINLFGSHQITEEGIKALAQNCSNLRSINLNFCSQISDEGIVALAQNCPKLQSIELAYCVEITDQCLQALGESCLHLQTIDLGSCYQITRQGVALLQEKLPHLKITR